MGLGRGSGRWNSASFGNTLPSTGEVGMTSKAVAMRQSVSWLVFIMMVGFAGVVTAEMLSEVQGFVLELLADLNSYNLIHQESFKPETQGGYFEIWSSNSDCIIFEFKFDTQIRGWDLKFRFTCNSDLNCRTDIQIRVQTQDSNWSWNWSLNLNFKLYFQILKSTKPKQGCKNSKAGKIVSHARHLLTLSTLSWKYCQAWLFCWKCDVVVSLLCGLVCICSKGSHPLQVDSCEIECRADGL